MPRKSTSLEAIRRQIDQIDNDLHTLLVKRARLVGRVAAAKARDGDGPVLRPEREAQVLRRLLRRSQGSLSTETVARIWRELFPAMVRLQGPLEVIVGGKDDALAHWDLARSQYGSATPTTRVGTPQRALGALARIEKAGGAAIAVLPMPSSRGEGLWWSKLMTEKPDGIGVIGKLPFVVGANGPAKDNEAMVVGNVEWRPSGDDQTLIIVAARANVSAARIKNWMKEKRLSAETVAVSASKGRSSERLHLLQVPAYMTAEDPRLEGFRNSAGDKVTKAIVVGGFPTCIDPAVLPRRGRKGKS
jgi:chorismate mutase / prephenate dehydratase